MREIFVSILPEFPKNFQWLPNITKDFRRLPNVAVQSSKSRRDLVSLLFRSQTRHLVSFTGIFWVEIEFNLSHLFNGSWTSTPELWVRHEKLSCMHVIDVFLSTSVWFMHNVCELAAIRSICTSIWPGKLLITNFRRKTKHHSITN